MGEERNPIQFAVVREDPEVELEVLARRAPSRALLIGSGGCTALAVASRHPDLPLTLLEPNDAQIALIERKIAALDGPLEAFNVGDDDPEGLSECGNFEALFRGLRRLLADLGPDPRLAFERADASLLTSHPYWPVVFEMYFSDALLNEMFGPDATQHAEPGSYPAYFRGVFERGLARGDWAVNPFLHHVLLGQYRSDAMPLFLVDRPKRPRFRYLQCMAADVDDFGPFDFIDLSNIFDWMPPDSVEALAGRLREELAPESTVVWRQLNNHRDLEALFGEAFVFEPEADLHRRDRSLFYSSLHVGVRCSA